jgi:hypothetical protein
MVAMTEETREMTQSHVDALLALAREQALADEPITLLGDGDVVFEEPPPTKRRPPPPPLRR